MASECTNLRSHSQTAFTVKWAASVIQMFLAGVLGWLIVGVLWNDRAIVLIHFVALGAMLWGMASQ